MPNNSYIAIPSMDYGCEAMSEVMKDNRPVLNRIREMLRNGEVEMKEASSVLRPGEVIQVLPSLLGEFSLNKIVDFYRGYVDAFLNLMPDIVDEGGKPIEGHPLRTLFDENREILMNAGELAVYASAEHENLSTLSKKLRRVGFTHYDRQEMILFPYLEKRGIGAVVTSIWRAHDQIRDDIRELNVRLSSGAFGVQQLAMSISVSLADVVMRENTLLLPTASVLLSDGEWRAIKEQESEIGYYIEEPDNLWSTDEEAVQAYEADPHISDEHMASLPPRVQSILKGMTLVGDYYDFVRNGDIKMDNGYLLSDEVNAIFNRLPVDLTFIDIDDRVRFFSGGGRSFVRTKSVLGRMVWFCHPPKSVSTVEKIIEAFKNGERDEAEFWIRINGRLMHIRYFAVRDRWGDYIGTLEMVQDITDLKKIEGERRLLDWEE